MRFKKNSLPNWWILEKNFNHSKNQYRTHRFVIHAILVFSVKFTVEFTSYAMIFSIQESKEKDLIIKAATWNIKTRTKFETFYFQ